MAKTHPSKPTPPRRTPTPWRVRLFVLLLLVVILVVAALHKGLHHYVQWTDTPHLKFIPQITTPQLAPQAENGNYPVVARTAVEEGTMLSTTTIDTSPETSATVKIEMLTIDQPSPTEKPHTIVDMTEQLQPTSPISTKAPPKAVEGASATTTPSMQAKNNTEHLATAHLVQTTLQLAQKQQQQNVRLTALAMALHARAPEVPALLQEATPHATPAQKALLTQVQQLWPVCQNSTARAVAKGEVVRPTTAPSWWPTWWDDTLGSFLTIRKQTAADIAVDTSAAAGACPREVLNTVRQNLLREAGVLPAVTETEEK